MIVVFGLIFGTILLSVTWNFVETNFSCINVNGDLQMGCNAFKNSIHLLMFGAPPIGIIGTLETSKRR